MGGAIFLIILVVLALWIVSSCIRIVPQAYAIVLERLEHIRLPGEQVFTLNCRLSSVLQEK